MKEHEEQKRGNEEEPLAIIPAPKSVLRKKGVLEILRITVDAPAALVRTLEEFIGPTVTSEDAFFQLRLKDVKLGEDSLDVTRPERLRKHQDVFEGVLTDSISSQLVEDAHRCEFSIEGRSFSLQDVLQLEGQQEERKKRIAQFQSELVHALETYLLSFCARKGLSPGGSKRLMQAVTTQMSQAGLANIDRGSEASRYFVGSQGLDQRIAYNLSTMYVHDQEALKLSIVCMRTGFTQYLDKDELLHLAGVQYPRRCKPDSYLYQYATLCFTIGPPVENSESIECSVLDALDEAQINAALGEDEEEVILDEAQLQVT